MDNMLKSLSLTIIDLVDTALHAPLWALLAWAIAAALTAAMISALASSSGQRLRVIVYIAVGLVAYVEVLRPIGWFLYFG